MASGWKFEGHGVKPRPLQATFHHGFPKAMNICGRSAALMNKFARLAFEMFKK